MPQRKRTTSQRTARRASVTRERRSADGARELLREQLIARLAERTPSGDHTARGLKRLLGLIDGDEGPERERSAECEAAIALRLLARGGRIQFEVPTERGRTADFLVRMNVHGTEERFALHVKRWTPPTERDSQMLRVPALVRTLERIRRPYLVGVRWPSARDQFESFVHGASRFLHQASVGDEWVFRDEGGEQAAGGVRVLAPWPGDRVVLTVGLDATIDEEIARVQRLLRKAYAQFVSNMPNVIALVGGERADERLIDTSIFGHHVERWDLFPPRGHRVAHGRGDDGFWSGERYSHSRAIAWFTWSDQRALGATRVWFRTRPDSDPNIRSLLR